MHLMLRKDAALEWSVKQVTSTTSEENLFSFFFMNRSKCLAFMAWEPRSRLRHHCPIFKKRPKQAAAE